MHTRIISSQLEASKLDEEVRWYRREFIPVLQAQKGCREVQLLVDRTTGKGKVIIYWDTEADIREFELNVPFQNFINQFKNNGFTFDKLHIENFEVVIKLEFQTV